MKRFILDSSGYSPYPINIVRAEDCYLFDDTGKQYVDFEGGVWCASVGHNNPRINTILIQQLTASGVAHLGYRYQNLDVEEAGDELLRALNFGDGKCLFLNSGSEAVEYSVQVARHISKKPLLLTLAGAYLSAYGSSGTKGEDEWYIFDWSHCAEGARDDQLLQSIPFDRIGGFVFEPGNSSGLVKFPPVWLINELVARVRQNSGLIIVDEVTTGFGRTGRWFGFNHYQLKPDIVAVGKGLGSGYPVSAVVMRAPIVDALMQDSSWHYGQSHQNSPQGCIVAREVIRLIRDKHLIERSEQLGFYFVEELAKLKSKYPCIKEIRGRGLMIVMELVNWASVTELYEDLLHKGFVVGCKPVAGILRFYPPLTVTKELISNLVDKLDVALRDYVQRRVQLAGTESFF
ncbi:MAG: aspartate aminotransferase family protein [Pseudomonadota bacterium]